MPRKGTTKITEQKFNDIARRLAAGFTPNEISQATGYSPSTVTEIRSLKTWSKFQERRKAYALRKQSANRAMNPAPLPAVSTPEAKPGFSPEVRKQVAKTMTQARDRAAAKKGVVLMPTGAQTVPAAQPAGPTVKDELAATNRRIDGLTKGSQDAFHTLEDDLHSVDVRVARVEKAIAATQRAEAREQVAHKRLSLMQRILRRFQS